MSVISAVVNSNSSPYDFLISLKIPEPTCKIISDALEFDGKYSVDMVAFSLAEESYMLPDSKHTLYITRKIREMCPNYFAHKVRASATPSSSQGEEKKEDMDEEENYDREVLSFFFKLFGFCCQMTTCCLTYLFLFKFNRTFLGTMYCVLT